MPNSDRIPEQFELPITIGPSDIDRLGHVNNVVYVRWVQDAAVAHWKATATHDQQAKYFWVVVRHEIDYKRAAKPEDNILARTWVGQASELEFERHTQIIRAGDGKILAQARTLWCPIDPRSGRPVRVQPDVRQRFSVGEKKS